jgi:methionyl-tRNA formyltransferase
MHSKKIIFLGSKPIGFECLEYLISQKDILNIEIAGILTNRRKEFGNNHDLIGLAQNHGIPVLNALDDAPECDIIYSVQYNKILKQPEISKATELAVNLHMAPLPEYRGSNQFSFAIIDEKKEFGATLHKIDTRIDHGDILFQKRFAIPENCWVNDLYELTYSASLNLFKQTLAHIINGIYQPVPQESLIPKFGTSLHYRKEMDTLKVIDMEWDREKIERHIRATSMPGFEPPYCVMDGEKVYFTKNCGDIT